MPQKSQSSGTTWPTKAAIFGASGGVGAALARLLVDNDVPVLAGSRKGQVPRHHLITPFSFDFEDESSIAGAAEAMEDDAPDLVIVASGVLTLEDGTGPERSYRSITADAMAEVMQVNAIGPALIARWVLPLMPRDKRWAFAALSAKVGSISDNQLGGWHSYRASKAALNMLIKNFALEMGRTHKQGIVLALHPGTVDTALSAPFHANLPEGQLTLRREAATRLLQVIKKTDPEDSGKLLSWDGSEIAP